MKNTIQKKKQEGFTIIEVLIVLAIAGLIILIVFLAVPALQRNSRNTQRKNDVSAIGGAFNEYINNNSGQLPTADGATGDNASTFENRVRPNAKLSYFDQNNDTAIEYYSNSTAADRAHPTGTDTIHIHSFTKCNGNDDTTAGASSRSVAALYRVETAGGDQPQCQEL